MAFKVNLGKSTKPKLMHKLTKIGIPTLDDRLKGLPSNSVILLLGDPGSGFDTFLHQVLYKRKQGGSNILYVSLDRSKEEISYDMGIYKWDCEDWDFIDLSPGAEKGTNQAMSWSMDSVNLVSHDLIRRLEELKQKAKHKALHTDIRLDSTINSLSSMLLNAESERSVISFLNEYAATIRDTNGFHFLTLLRGVHGEQTERLLAHIADVVLEFLTVREGNEYTRVLGIKKMRGIVAPPSSLFRLEFTEKGVLPVTTTRVK
jgi:KaiC/GvpD/RAD55 family RecA-like ATPase